MLRLARPADLEAIQDIQRQTPEASAWRANAEDCLVFESNGEIAGFLVFRRIFDESEILNLGVTPSFRRQGIASALIGHLAENHAGDILLEVRASNSPALALYRSLGFIVDGRRKAYYHRPVEDAILLRRPDGYGDALVEIDS